MKSGRDKTQKKEEKILSVLVVKKGLTTETRRHGEVIYDFKRKIISVSQCLRGEILDILK